MWLVWSGLACTNSGLGGDTTLSTGDTGTDTTVTGLADCPWVGTWDLQSVSCNTFPFDSWYDAHDDASMEIDHDPAGGCAVQTRITGASCDRTEGWHFTLPVGTSVEVTYQGYTACDPDACTFEPSDAACAVGDGPSGTEPVTIDDLGEELTVVGLIADTASLCTLDVVTRWAR